MKNSTNLRTGGSPEKDNLWCSTQRDGCFSSKLYDQPQTSTNLSTSRQNANQSYGGGQGGVGNIQFSSVQEDTSRMIMTSTIS